MKYLLALMILLSQNAIAMDRPELVRDLNEAKWKQAEEVLDDQRELNQILVFKKNDSAGNPKWEFYLVRNDLEQTYERVTYCYGALVRRTSISHEM